MSTNLTEKTYEEDIIDEHNKFVEAKNMRKRAEEDAQLLSNRIALLKLEEQRSLKKIEETRNKAREIMQRKAEMLEELRVKEEEKNKRLEEEKARLEQNKLNKELSKQARLTTREEMVKKLKEEVMAIKLAKKENQSLIEQNKNMELLEKATVTQSIKSMHREAEEKKRRSEEERKAKVRAELERKIEEENAKKQQKEDDIARMEQEELELIQRLQNSQMMQRSAYEELELAMSGSLTPANFNGSEPTIYPKNQ
ncbi:hypothetical protein SteCoe_1800 [Stentor coeruleus]|uniref:Trichohyalin-plectin-homology domain-containing protein n=1 Tax=Stentor coeruleus TaxID=5963 RepID=A0A1R2D142_9CILI|nr:hypothetical protein SteCoe_1800 [Stentor coeruleus]